MNATTHSVEKNESQSTRFEKRIPETPLVTACRRSRCMSRRTSAHIGSAVHPRPPDLQAIAPQSPFSGCHERSCALLHPQTRHNPDRPDPEDGSHLLNCSTALPSRTTGALHHIPEQPLTCSTASTTRRAEGPPGRSGRMR